MTAAGPGARPAPGSPRASWRAPSSDDGAKVGDVLKVEADFFVDGIQITQVITSSRVRPEVQRLEILGSGKADEPLVTTTLARGGRPGRPRRPWPPP